MEILFNTHAEGKKIYKVRSEENDQLFMGTRFHDPALVEHVDVIGALNRGEPVGNDDGRPVRQEVSQSFLDK